MTNLNRVVKNTGILYLRMAATVLISLSSTRLTLSALGVTDFGLFNLVGGVISMLAFLNSAMAAATQRFMSYAEGAGDIHRLKEIFNVSVFLHIIIAICVFLILEVIGFYLLDQVLEIPESRLNTAKIILQFMIFSTVFTITSVPYEAVIISHENMFLLAVLGIVESVGKLGIAFYLGYSNFDKLSTYGFLTALLSVSMLLLKRVFCHSKYLECKINFIKYFNKVTFKEMSLFASWSLLGSSTSIFSSYGQGIVLNIFFGPIVNAAQAVSNQVSGQLSVFSGTMLKALNPIIAKSEGAGNRAFMLKTTLVGTKFSFFLLILFYIPAIIEMDYIFTFWLNQVPEYAVIFCRLLLLRNLIEQFYITITNSISAVGKIKVFQISKTILNLFPLLFTIIFFKLGFQPYIMYVIFVFYAIADALVTLFFAKKHCKLSYKVFFQTTFLPCSLIAIVAYLIAYVPFYLLNGGWGRLFLVFFASTISIICNIWFFGLEISEKENVINFFNNFQSKLKKYNFKISTK
ncbi:MAG: MATE family efflux transporter [Leadbetterella sp.]|nr:MATE family efflux transporter [Leadbetterella sp.]